MQPVIEVPVKTMQVYVPPREAIALFERYARKHRLGFPAGYLILAWLLCCAAQVWNDSGIHEGLMYTGEFHGLVFDWHAMLVISLGFLFISLAAFPFALLLKHNALLFAHTINLPQWNEILQIVDETRKFSVKIDPYSKAKPPLAVLGSKLIELREYYMYHTPITKHKDIIVFPIGVFFVIYLMVAHLAITVYVLQWSFGTAKFTGDGFAFIAIATIGILGFDQARRAAFYHMALDELVKECGESSQAE